MTGPRKDHTGEQYGRYTVLRVGPKRESNGCYLWYCRCSCGAVKLVHVYDLKKGSIVSCGCWAIESARSKRGKPSGRKGKIVGPYKLKRGGRVDPEAMAKLFS